MAGLRFIPPQMPTLVEEPPEGAGWIHEVKYDGYRTQIIVEDGEAHAFTRNGHDWTERYRPIIDQAERLPCRSAIIDGELIIQDAQGRSDFHGLKRATDRERSRLVFMAFDMMHLNGTDLRKRPLFERRDMLKLLLGANDPASPPDPHPLVAAQLILLTLVAGGGDGRR